MFLNPYNPFVTRLSLCGLSSRFYKEFSVVGWLVSADRYVKKRDETLQEELWELKLYVALETNTGSEKYCEKLTPVYYISGAL